MSGRIYVVTGSNKGIGYATVKALCEKANQNDVVYLTSRSAERGVQAVQNLEKDGLKAKFLPLVVEDKASVSSFANSLKKEHGGIDVLVNNAAMAYKQSATEPFGEQAENTIAVNYYGLKNVCKELFPLLRPHGRVVNVSSCVGHLMKVPGEDLRAKLSSDSLTEEQLDDMVNGFVKAAKAGNHSALGWQNSTYGVSKVAASALTRIQNKKFEADPREDIIINHCHPGYVDTDMTSHKGILTIEQGCVASVFLATIPKNATSPRGEYVWHDKKIVDWVNGPLPEPGY